MPRIGITGHMNLSPETADLVARDVRRILKPLASQDLVGVSCLAAGADSIFARAVLDLGGKLEVILPSENYRERKVRAEQRPLFDFFISAASDITVGPFAEPSRDAYEAANQALLSKADVLIAVWDGEAPADKGGTAAVVASASGRQIPVQVVWPEGAQRS